MLSKFIFKLISLQLFLFQFVSVSAQDYQRKVESEDLSVSINGTFISKSHISKDKICSENGKYWCTYEINKVSDEFRELVNFKFYLRDEFLFTLPKAPGSDVQISNSGFIVFYDHSEHFKGNISLNFYSPNGESLFRKVYSSADMFIFSKSGIKLGVRTNKNISIISLPDGNIKNYEKGLQFNISENDRLTAVVLHNKIKIYRDGFLIKSIKSKISTPRKIKISADKQIIAVINKRNLYVYSITEGRLLFSDQLSGNHSFRDLKFSGNNIVSGIHKRTEYESTGLINIYSLEGKLVEERQSSSKQLKRFFKTYFQKENMLGYDPIPWPFAPFDSMRTIWNHYEQHMGSGISSSYLHQGLDIITPVAEPTYAVADGYVKCVLTLGGSSYWRIAISDTQVAGYSDGWLYAHLIQNTIQFDVGDTVQIHDYLGDIVQWSSNWGHIHFVQIRDSGLVWSYSDNEWGINFNPMLALQPLNDTTPPLIDTVFNYSKFGFCLNESSTYLQPDSLYGDIDIIVKVIDYAGASEWQQPAYRTYYWIKKIPGDSVIFPRTMGQLLNHQYPFYSSSSYQPYATVIYKRDAILHGSSWMDTVRNFHHVVTNSNGDSSIELSEKNLAFSTTNHIDGDYRLFIEVFDEAGNSAIDSMEVVFKNGIVSVTENNNSIRKYHLEQNYPNPFNPKTFIRFSIPRSEFTQLIVYDALGRKIAILVNESLKSGNYEIVWPAPTENASNYPSGVYYYKLTSGNYKTIKKMVLLK
jgi:murein DD-endopeptidase MepM/ murein hydrolase activator NlpD